MWPRMRALSFNKGAQKSTVPLPSLNVNEEYLSVLRTDSYSDYFTKAQLLAQQPSSSTASHSYANLSEFLLEPVQESIAVILDSAIFSRNSDLKKLVRDYFEISAEASRICTSLLDGVRQTQSNHRYIQKALELMKEKDGSSPQDYKYPAMAELDSFNLLKNPFATTNQNVFNLIHERYSAMLLHLKSKKKKVARKIKLIKYLNKGSQIALTAACGVLATVVVILAVHTLSGLLVGPALFSCSPLRLKKKITKLPFLNLKSRFLRKLREQLDVAAKGTYILNRDFDTMSRLVERLHDEIEHNKAIIRFCLERREDKFPLQEVVKELKKTDEAFMKQVEELEEHVYLCLVTINKARVLVIKEVTVSHGGSGVR
ncbi:UPF0496 protein At1g20180-like [Aristolochia californica]|uniref:UPF0496 protein At1g20180-like n=1 Tax=Aristolochia californica TaxID=171875 RepID=UPI0035DC6FE1